MRPLVHFQKVSKQYGPVHALRDLTLPIESKSLVAILGPNGAGKSTLLGCLLGLIKPTAGTVVWRGQPVTDADRSRFGYVAERIALYPHRTLWDNGLFFARLRNQNAAELERQLHRVGLWAVRQRKVRQLSKGMLQRLGLAIALCGQPELLVLDEPFNGLDPALLESLQQLLKEEQQRGATLLIATHTISAIESLATHVAILLSGQLAAFDTISAIHSQYPELFSLEAIYHRIARQGQSSELLSIAA